MELQDWHMWWKREGARGLRRLLMQDWDPIHVQGVPEAADEYDGYLSQIASRLRAGTTAEALATYLSWVEEEMMDLRGSAESRANATAVAARIIQWYEASTDAWPRRE
jgi:hypothetical protein